MLAGTLFVPVVAGLYWSRATKTGVLAGMTCGGGTVLGWQLARNTVLSSALSVVEPVIPGLLVSTVALVAGTLLAE